MTGTGRPTKRKNALLSFLATVFRIDADAMLRQSMEDFSLRRFRTALLCGADPNIYAQIGKDYPLVTRAARSGETEFLRLLLEFGADPMFGSEDGLFQPIHMAALKNMDGCIRELVAFGADPDARYTHDMDGTRIADGKGLTALYLAAIHGKEEAAIALLECGADIDDIGAKGESFTSVAVHHPELRDKILELKRKTTAS